MKLDNATLAVSCYTYKHVLLTLKCLREHIKRYFQFYLPGCAQSVEFCAFPVQFRSKGRITVDFILVFRSLEYERGSAEIGKIYFADSL